jgi:hypothetical protein
MEAVDLPASASLGLKRSESEQREPVRMILTGHQLERALALAFGSPAAQEPPMVQEEPQQVKVWVAQMAPQREVGAQPRVEVLHQRTAARGVFHDLHYGGEDGVELAAHAGGPIHACTTLEESGPTLSTNADSSGVVRVTLA